MKYTALPDDTIDNAKIFFFIENKSKFNQRKIVLDLFTCHQRETLIVPKEVRGKKIIGVDLTESEKYAFEDIFICHIPNGDSDLDDFSITDATNEYSPYGVLIPSGSEKKLFLLKLADTADTRVYEFYQQFYIHPGDIENYTGKDPLLTDVGKFYLNELLLVQPFKDIIPYYNDTFVASTIDKMVANGIISGTINRDMYTKYINNGYWFADGSIFAPGWSEKSITIDPAIIKRRNDLLEEYKDKLDDPLVITRIEKELVDMDKAYMKGDSSESFYLAMGGKSFTDQRKKLFIMFGLAAEFGGSGYSFVRESLSEGWTPQNLAVGANNLREGSYGRGVETAKGGEQTKFILRIFQEVGITEDDCGSEHGLPIEITELNKSQFVNRYTVDGKLLTEEELNKSIGKEVIIRSPMYCKAQKGYCFKCCGKVYADINNRSIGIDSINITSGFTSTAMAKMHVSSISTSKIDNMKEIFRFKGIKQ